MVARLRPELEDMMSMITATGIAAAGDLRHSVTDGAPYADVAEGETLYTFEAGATRIVVTGTPDELRGLAAGIVAQIDAFEQLAKREA